MTMKTVSGMVVFELWYFETIFDENSAKYEETLNIKINPQKWCLIERAWHEDSKINNKDFFRYVLNEFTRFSTTFNENSVYNIESLKMKIHPHKVGVCLKGLDARFPKMNIKTFVGIVNFDILLLKAVFRLYFPCIFICRS